MYVLLLLSDVQTYIDNSFFITDIEEYDVISAIKILKDSCAGFDHIPSNIAKELINGYLMSLTRRLNRFLKEGIFSGSNFESYSNF